MEKLIINNKIYSQYGFPLEKELESKIVEYSKHIFGDDKGWILNKISNITYWGISSIKSDYYTIGERDIFRYGSKNSFVKVVLIPILMHPVSRLIKSVNLCSALLIYSIACFIYL